MSLPTIESSYVTHTTKGIEGFNHPDYPVLRVALEVLNATESYLWVSVLLLDLPPMPHPASALHTGIWIGLRCICIA